MQLLKYLLLSSLALGVLSCVPKMYVKVPESSADGDVVRVPRAQARQAWIISIDDFKFEGFNNDLLYIPAGKHEIQFKPSPVLTVRSTYIPNEASDLVVKLTRTFKPGSVIQMCPGLNENTYKNKNLPEKERWSPFIRTIDEGSMTQAMSMMNPQDCTWAFGAKGPTILE